jgi:hypothetical protein
MAFIRAKKSKTKTYYQICESYRDQGKVKQRVLAHLGEYDNAVDAFIGLRDELSTYQGYLAGHRSRMFGRRSGFTKAGLKRTIESHRRAIAALLPLVGLNADASEIEIATRSIELRMMILMGKRND